MSKSNMIFWNSGDARILAAVLAIVLAVFAYLQYRDASEVSMATGPTASDLPALGVSTAVTKCVELSLVNIEQMVKDGYLKEDGVAKAKEQAEGLCISQTR